MRDSTFETCPDWDLFSSHKDSQNAFTPTTTPNIICGPDEYKSTSCDVNGDTQLRTDPCIDNAEEAYLFPAEQFIKLDSFDNEVSLFADPTTASTDNTEISSDELLPIPTIPSLSPSTLLSSTYTSLPLASHNHLHNLPAEIVHRPPYPFPVPFPKRSQPISVLMTVPGYINSSKKCSKTSTYVTSFLFHCLYL